MTSYYNSDLTNTGSGNGFVPSGTKPLAEPMLIYHQWGRWNLDALVTHRARSSAALIAISSLPWGRISTMWGMISNTNKYSVFCQGYREMWTEGSSHWKRWGHGNFSGVIAIILSLLISKLWGHGPLQTKIIGDIPDFTVLIVPIFQPRHSTEYFIYFFSNHSTSTVLSFPYL